MMKLLRSSLTRLLITLVISACGAGSGIVGIATGGNGGGTSGASSSISFFTQPNSSNTGQVISPAIEVVARDSLGQTDSSFTASVTVSLSSNTTGGVLSGTTVRTPVNGIVSFDDLRVDKVGTYTLTAITSGLPAITSGAFTVTAPTGP